MDSRVLAVVLVCLFVPVACSSGDGTDPAAGTNASGGDVTTAGAMGTMGATSSGGATFGANSVGGTTDASSATVTSTMTVSSTTATTSGASVSSAGGMGGTGASSGGLDGSGGLGTTGGGAGNAGAGTTGGGTGGSTANPSAGCGRGGRPDGGRVVEAGVSWLVFPEKYDGTTPLPVLWGWHGCGEYNFGDANRTEYWDETRNSGFETDYVIAIPLAASGDCFDYNTDIVRTKALYDELTENYCVDLDRMFGTGHSSGANFLHRMLQTEHLADWEHLSLRGIAPVASGPVANHTTQVPTMYIHSPGESVDPQGPADNFLNANGCSMSSMPHAVDSCNSTHDGDPVDSKCASYEGCDVTTIFCPHDDSAYSGTFHGIPCFFKQAAYDFFASL